MIRLATPADVNFIDWLQNRPFAKDAGWLRLAAIEERLALAQVYVQCVNAQQAGYAVAATRQDKLCHLTQIVISDELWRLGYGTQLMGRVIDDARRAGATAITLKTVVGGIANNFWPRLGFTHVGTATGRRRLLNHWCLPLTIPEPVMAPLSRQPRDSWADCRAATPVIRHI